MVTIFNRLQSVVNLTVGAKEYLTRLFPVRIIRVNLPGTLV